MTKSRIIPQKPRRKIPGSVRLPVTIRDELKEYAHTRRSSVGAILRDIVEQYAEVPPTEWAEPLVNEPRPTVIFAIDPLVLERAQKRAEAENIPLAQMVQQRVVDKLAPH